MLTPKQKAFADYYIECGNATEAARKAGYSEKNAHTIAAQNLAKLSISNYIEERMAQQDANRVASADEVVRFYTSVMRGEVKDSFGLDASLSDRIRAADSLMKRYAVGADRQRGTMDKLDNLLKEMRDAAVDTETGGIHP